MTPQFALIHSPLCGPDTWLPVAEELRQRECVALVPTLLDTGDGSSPYWDQHAASVAAALDAIPFGQQPLILVAHSGAGPLLPAIRRKLARPVVAYLFADAGLPHSGLSRLDEIARNAPEIVDPLRAHLSAGGCYPTWQDADLRGLIPDDRRRAAVLGGLRPRALGFFTEPLPPNPGWPDAPCGYLRFSAAYDPQAAAARALGWPVQTYDAGHFHQLVDPAGVAEGLLALARRLSVLR